GDTPQPPASLRSVLRDSQTVGFGWLKALERIGCGGIMADEMGLGKTLQTIALLLDAKEQGNSTPSLVVCPTSLVLNWESEIRRFAPDLSVLSIIGSAEQREELLHSCGRYDVILTSYDMLKRDVALYAGRRFAYHILDEAQYIKNPHTQNARAVKAIASNQRFALTGTPIENRISELWSIFDFLMPGFLYSYSRFRSQFESPILRDGDDVAREQLRRLVEPFILRRLKQDVLQELPPKTEQVLLVPLNEEQRQLYAANLAQARQQVQIPGTNKMAVLALLTRLRQLCCDPALCYEDYRGGSAKLDSCMELLRQGVENGHKILVFSQFTSLLDLLQKQLSREHMRFYRLDGSTPKEQRATSIEAFNRDDTPVFLISLKAGGTGLNLVGADTVIHFDPWWNLAAQEQATDRAHRIGQTRPVQVIKLIAKDTVEERILQLQERKQGLADALIPTGEGLAGMTAEELRALLEQG
ncbi:MAG: DEAD/DEAH box helicase, partial [Clostridia bacterium]|nr:DEAD/DEAH box helicase [Clostridia bacterium]